MLHFHLSTHRIYALKNTTLIDIVDISTLTTNVNSKQALCVNGRFNIGINVDAVANGGLGPGIHSVRLILEAKDANGQVVTNPAQGTANITITK